MQAQNRCNTWSNVLCRSISTAYCNWCSWSTSLHNSSYYSWVGCTPHVPLFYELQELNIIQPNIKFGILASGNQVKEKGW